MSHAASPFTERRYGVVRVTREWEMARSSFYHQRALAARPDRVLGRRGPKTAWSDAALLGKIREVLAASPFYGEGHRKVWARLRFEQVRTSKARVLRLMREAQLLAPSRTLPRPENPHTGTIITERPNEVWASDHTLTATVEEGQVTVFVAVDHCTTECVGLHAAKKATRFEALGTCNGFSISAGSNTIKNLVINNFTAHGVSMFGGATGISLQGNYIGTNPTGTAAAGNAAFGVTSASGANFIGGLGAGEGNVISGNGFGGVAITLYDEVKGNFIGTNAAGTGPIANTGPGVVGAGGQNNQILGNLHLRQRNLRD